MENNKITVLFLMEYSNDGNSNSSSSSSSISSRNSINSEAENIEEENNADSLLLPLLLYMSNELEESGFIPISGQSPGTRPICAKLSFYVFLWYISNTEPLRTISERFYISISSVFRILRRVAAWFVTKSDEVIVWPSEQVIPVIVNKFRSKKGLKSVLGAIDSTHIGILKPIVDARFYCNRKKSFSINLQAVVDCDLRFRNIYCGEPGSLHDAHVFRKSLLYDTATVHKAALFPGKTFLLGDSAYSSLSWVVPTFKDNGHLSEEQHQFNYRHSSTRIVVEQAFGLLKERFRRLKFFTEYRKIGFITDSVVAACVLHNLCISENSNFNFEQCNDTNFVHVGSEEINSGNEIIDRRTLLFRELFPLQYKFIY
ncbi:uncharacterized protein [Prorops nasuta]|uniref:uncharacterized protein n=1 Tax=Prorops nasuta TaxID=863751 RepID=UPI0034CFD66C